MDADRDRPDLRPPQSSRESRHLAAVRGLTSRRGSRSGPRRSVVSAAGVPLLFGLLAAPAPSAANPPAHLTQWGEYGSGNGQLILPTGVAVTDGTVCVADNDNRRIQKFGSSPTATRAASWGGIKGGYR